MKLTKKYITQLIREELENVFEQTPDPTGANVSSKIKDVEAAQQRTGQQVDKKMASVTTDADIVPLAASQAVKVLKNSKNPAALIPKVLAAIKSQVGAK
tara:strand:+ start:1018 stop:1314 length:297 start_codon:yes stop_codon:yes gene_type:complete